MEKNKNQALPNNHFCMKISKVPNSHQQETQYSLIAHRVLEMSAGGGGNLHMSLYRDVPLFWVLFWGCSRIFGYLFGLFPDFWVSFLAIPGFLGVIFW